MQERGDGDAGGAGGRAAGRVPVARAAASRRHARRRVPPRRAPAPAPRAAARPHLPAHGNPTPLLLSSPSHSLPHLHFSPSLAGPPTSTALFLLLNTKVGFSI